MVADRAGDGVELDPLGRGCFRGRDQLLRLRGIQLEALAQQRLDARAFGRVEVAVEKGGFDQQTGGCVMESAVAMCAGGDVRLSGAEEKLFQAIDYAGPMRGFRAESADRRDPTGG